MSHTCINIYARCTAEQERTGGKEKDGTGMAKNSSIRWHPDLSKPHTFSIFNYLSGCFKASKVPKEQAYHSYWNLHAHMCSFSHLSSCTAQPPLWKPQESLAFKQNGSLNLWCRAARLYDPQWLKLMPKLSQRGIWGWRETSQVNASFCTGNDTTGAAPLWSGAFISWKDCSKTKTHLWGS